MTDTPLDQIYLNNYFHLLGVVILFYDHMLTLPDESKYIWRNPRTGASCLFLINRYFALISNIVMTAGNFWLFDTVESCEHYSTYRLASLITTQVLVGVIQLLRTYALYRRDRRVLSLMIVVAVGLFAGAVYVAIGPTPGVSLNDGCTITSPRHVARQYAFAWEALFIWDSLIFTLTIVKTYKGLLQRRTIVGTQNLVTLIVRDGAVYFAIMACAQCANSLTYYFLSPALIGVLSTLASSISVTMMSRLLLNLHRKATLVTTAFTAEPGYAQSTHMVFCAQLAAKGPRNSLMESEDNSTDSSRSAIGTSGPLAEDVELNAIN